MSSIIGHLLFTLIKNKSANILIQFLSVSSSIALIQKYFSQFTKS